MEILFPAGSLKHIDVAIRSGVDAVYGGFKQWNARDKAENFSIKEYNYVIQKLHKNNIKFYLTLNTLMFDNDIEDIIQILKSGKVNAPDAFVATDIGLIQELKNHFPNIPIHLSTQLGIHNFQDVGMAEYLGADRVILSRELTKDKVKEISRNAKLKIECFVYGSQCISFSGQCYFSSLLNGGSGNRGKCEIFCRDKYSANGKIGDLLYVQDLNCSDVMTDLPKVYSWKLEGRKRNPIEVGNFVKNLKQGETPSVQTGYMYGKTIKDNKLFNQKHIRSVPLAYNSDYDIHGNNISFDIKVENGVVIELTYIDDQGQGTKFINKSPCEFINFDIDEFINNIQSVSGKNVYKINCNGDTNRLIIDRKIQDKILNSIVTVQKSKQIETLSDNAWIEVDNIKHLNILTKEFPYKTFIYNINSIKNLQSLEINTNHNIIYKLPMFNFDNIDLSGMYEKLQGSRVMFSHIGQIKSLDGIKLAERIADYTIPIWNKSTLKYIKSQKIDIFTASPELSFEQNESILNDVARNYIMYGRLPLVYSRMCFKHLFNCKSCNFNQLKEINNLDKGLNFDVKCYQDYRVILSKNPILNQYPKSGGNTSYRLVTTGMSLDKIRDILNDKNMMVKNSYACNIQTTRR